MHKDQPADVDSGRTDVDHFPVEDRGWREAIKQNVARSRVAPVDNGGSGIARLAIGKPSQGLFNDWQAQIATRPVVISTLLG